MSRHRGDSFRRLLDDVAAGLRLFGVAPSRVRVLREPHAFHHEVVRACATATSRVSLAALYLGSGSREQQVVAALQTACRRSPRLKVRVVLDGARARRREFGATSLDVLAPLVSEFPARVLVATRDALPTRGAWWCRIVDRLPVLGVIAEILGVFHVKTVACDDRVVLTGANLSATYFSDRVDRYFVVRDAAFASWHHELVDVLATTPLDELSGALRRHCSSPTRVRRPKTRNLVWFAPAAQLGSRLRLEEGVMRGLLAARGRVGLATAYLNPPSDVARAIAARPRRVTILAPSIDAHGFGEAKNIKSNVPKAYQLIAADLASALLPKHQLKEWRHDAKTFHAKGVWVLGNGFAATLIGSSNWNVRARRRDLELSYVVATGNPKVRRRIKGEWTGFLRHATPPRTLLARPQNLPLWVAVFRPIINTFL